MVTPAFAQSGGADIYKAKCLMCHGAAGLGDTPTCKALKAASFKDPAAIKASDAELIGIVTKGKNKMPAYEGKLTAKPARPKKLSAKSLSAKNLRAPSLRLFSGARVGDEEAKVGAALKGHGGAPSGSRAVNVTKSTGL